MRFTRVDCAKTNEFQLKMWSFPLSKGWCVFFYFLVLLFYFLLTGSSFHTMIRNLFFCNSFSESINGSVGFVSLFMVELNATLSLSVAAALLCVTLDLMKEGNQTNGLFCWQLTIVLLCCLFCFLFFALFVNFFFASAYDNA